MSEVEALINTIGEWLLIFTGIACCFVDHPVVGSCAIAISFILGTARFYTVMKKS